MVQSAVPNVRHFSDVAKGVGTKIDLNFPSMTVFLDPTIAPSTSKTIKNVLNADYIIYLNLNI